MPISFQNIEDPGDLTVWSVDDSYPENLVAWLEDELPEGVNFETASHPEELRQKLHAKPTLTKYNFDRLLDKGGHFLTAVYSQGFGTRPDNFRDAEKSHPLDLPNPDTGISDVFLEGVPENMVTVRKSDNPVSDFLKALLHFDRLIAL